MAFSKKMEPDLPASAPHKYCGLMGGCEFGKKILLTLVGVLLVYLIFFIGTLLRNNIKTFNYIGQADQMERTITVTGYGKVTAKNDIAMTTLGYTNRDVDVAKAQINNSAVINKIMGDLRSMGIGDKDLQTNYSIYPEYSYTQDKGQQFSGYRVDSSATIKIRDLKNITPILSLAAKYGANQVGNLNFTIDDTQNLKDEARLKALAEAKAKARALARSLGVLIGEVVSYSDYDAQPEYPIYAMKSMSLDAAGSVAPVDIAPGSKDVAMNVAVTYKIYSPAW